MPENACRSQSETADLRVETLPFCEIPGQSKLFLDYLESPKSLSEFYPNVVSRFDDLVYRVEDVLANYATDRAILCDTLEAQNRSFGCGQATLDRIKLLRCSDCVAVMTGQQAGLFTGPLYSIYKALSAIRAAEVLLEKGVNAVPVFWIATEDHDIAEVSNAFAISTEGKLIEVKVKATEGDLGKPVGSVAFDASIRSVIEEFLTAMTETEFSSDLERDLIETYASNETFGSSFGKLLTRLLGKYGLIVFDPMDSRVKQVPVPLVKNAVERSEEIVDALIARSKKLEASGYHAQVLVEEDYFPLFWQDDDAIRRSLKRTDKGKYKASGTKIEFTRDDLSEFAETEPQRLSPGVMLRPVVQDFLFPTICYFGGAAEIAYFAQNSEVYRILERPVTPLLPRQSFTVVEARHARTMKKYGIAFEDLFDGLEKLRPRIVENVIDPETPRVFAYAEEKINTELNRLDQQLSKVDPTLAESLAKRRRKIIYHISALRQKFQRVRIEKDETINRQITSMFISLYPNGALQERSLNFSVFANRYGPEIVDWLYQTVDLDDNDHKLLYS